MVWLQRHEGTKKISKQARRLSALPAKKKIAGKKIRRECGLATKARRHKENQQASKTSFRLTGKEENSR
jgi:hypothetical protein